MLRDTLEEVERKVPAGPPAALPGGGMAAVLGLARVGRGPVSRAAMSFGVTQMHTEASYSPAGLERSSGGRAFSPQPGRSRDRCSRSLWY